MKMAIEIGRLLRAGTTGFVAGCRVSQIDAPSFGALVRAPVEAGYQIYGLIYDIHIDDDGLVRQLVTTEGIDEAVIADNRVNRNVPIEMSVLAVGYQQNGKLFHLLPPRPALSLDAIYLCDDQELRDFTNTGRFGYFRHLLRSNELPVGDLLAAHINQVQEVQVEAGNENWAVEATQELIVLLRDDYATLMRVISTLADAIPETWEGVR
ncbi:MAG: hypothetical protein WA997_12865 [Anaerolineales bacterium]|nr:hypothetical protein [Anaerolineales bacterium]HUV27304.1 hypothetical protein [Anaerolineales bacterium]